jgi:hypothetical protein
MALPLAVSALEDENMAGSWRRFVPVDILSTLFSHSSVQLLTKKSPD